MNLQDQQLIRAIENEVSRQSGRHYRVKWDRLDNDSLRAILNLLRDLDHEKRMAARRAMIMPWRPV